MKKYITLITFFFSLQIFAITWKATAYTSDGKEIVYSLKNKQMKLSLPKTSITCSISQIKENKDEENSDY